MILLMAAPRIAGLPVLDLASSGIRGWRGRLSQGRLEHISLMGSGRREIRVIATSLLGRNDGIIGGFMEPKVENLNKYLKATFHAHVIDPLQ